MEVVNNALEVRRFPKISKNGKPIPCQKNVANNPENYLSISFLNEFEKILYISMYNFRWENLFSAKQFGSRSTH